MLIEETRNVETYDRDHLLERLRFGLINVDRVKSAAVLGNEICASLFPLTQEDIDPYNFKGGNHWIRPKDCVLWTSQLKIYKAVSLLTAEEADPWAEILLKRVADRIKERELSGAIEDIHKRIKECAPGEKVPTIREEIYELTGGDGAHARRSNLRRSALLLLALLGKVPELFMPETGISWTFLHPAANKWFEAKDNKVLLAAALTYASEYSVREMAFQKADAIRFLLR